METSIKEEEKRDELYNLGASHNGLAAGLMDIRLSKWGRPASQKKDAIVCELRSKSIRQMPNVRDFLVHVEDKRRNSARSRNAGVAAIRSFFRFVAMKEPAHLLHCQKILAIPSKRYERRTVEFQVQRLKGAAAQ